MDSTSGSSFIRSTANPINSVANSQRNDNAARNFAWTNSAHGPITGGIHPSVANAATSTRSSEPVRPMPMTPGDSRIVDQSLGKWKWKSKAVVPTAFWGRALHVERTKDTRAIEYAIFHEQRDSMHQGLSQVLKLRADQIPETTRECIGESTGTVLHFEPLAAGTAPASTEFVQMYAPPLTGSKAKDQATGTVLKIASELLNMTPADAQKQLEHLRKVDSNLAIQVAHALDISPAERESSQHALGLTQSSDACEENVASHIGNEVALTMEETVVRDDYKVNVFSDIAIFSRHCTTKATIPNENASFEFGKKVLVDNLKFRTRFLEHSYESTIENTNYFSHIANEEQFLEVLREGNPTATIGAFPVSKRDVETYAFLRACTEVFRAIKPGNHDAYFRGNEFVKTIYHSLAKQLAIPAEWISAEGKHKRIPTFLMNENMIRCAELLNEMFYKEIVLFTHHIIGKHDAKIELLRSPTVDWINDRQAVMKMFYATSRSDS